MTVCMALAAQENTGEPLLVLCTDWKKSSLLGSTEHTDKLEHVKGPWVALWAGDISNARFLLGKLRSEFASVKTVAEDNVCLLVRSACAAMKHDMADELIRSRYGISYDQFLEQGREKFPQDEFREAMASVRNMNLGVALIVAGISEGALTICKVDEKGYVSLHEDFAAIGAGEVIASATLLSRQHSSVASMWRSIYHAYEAKKAAESVGSVGEFTSVDVLKADGTAMLLSVEAEKQLELLRKELRPVLTSARLESFEKAHGGTLEQYRTDAR